MVEKNELGEDFDPVPHLAQALLSILKIGEGVVTENDQYSLIVYRKEVDLIVFVDNNKCEAYEDAAMTRPVKKLTPGSLVWMHGDETWN